ARLAPGAQEPVLDLVAEPRPAAHHVFDPLAVLGVDRLEPAAGIALELGRVAPPRAGVGGTRVVAGRIARRASPEDVVHVVGDDPEAGFARLPVAEGLFALPGASELHAHLEQKRLDARI